MVGDLIAGTRLWELFESLAFTKGSKLYHVFYFRISVSHLILALSKYCELYKRFKSVIPKSVLSKAKSLSAQINDKGIISFRNKVIGHIWDDDLNRPLTSEETDQRLGAILAPDPTAFLKWINNHKNGNIAGSVVATCESIKEAIKAEYKLSETEIFDAEDKK